MKIRNWFAIGAVLLGAAGTVPGAFGEDDGVPRADMKQMKAIVAGMIKMAGDVRLTESDAESLVLHGPGFNALGEDAEGGDRFEKLLEARYKKDGVYDFELLLADKSLLAWAAKVKVDARSWLRRAMRAHSLFMREESEAQAAQLRASLKEQLAQLEAERQRMGEEAFQAAKASMEASLAIAKHMEALAASVPAPMDGEKKVLEKYGKKLRQALDLGDGEDGDEEEEEEGEDEEDDD